VRGKALTILRKNHSSSRLHSSPFDISYLLYMISFYQN